MKSKDQILLEQIYGNLLKEQEDEHLESDYELRTDMEDEEMPTPEVEEVSDEEEEEDEEETEEEPSEGETVLQKQAETVLDPNAPEEGLDDQELDIITKLIQNN
jgi:predicted transcriptional regulator